MMNSDNNSIVALPRDVEPIFPDRCPLSGRTPDVDCQFRYLAPVSAWLNQSAFANKFIKLSIPAAKSAKLLHGAMPNLFKFVTYLLLVSIFFYIIKVGEYDESFNHPNALLDTLTSLPTLIFLGALWIGLLLFGRRPMRAWADSDMIYFWFADADYREEFRELNRRQARAQSEDEIRIG